MIKIAICDDDLQKTFYIESLLQKIKNSVKNKYNLSLEIEVFTSAEDLIKAYDLNFFDLILLDIEMNNLSGIDAALYLREHLNNQDTHIIYISGYANYFIQLFDTKPSGFIKKPINIDEFFTKVTNVIDKIVLSNKKTNLKRLRIVTKKRTYFVPIQEIIFFESKARKIRIVTFEHELSFYDKLINIERNLKDYNFIRIHQSYLVNLHHIFCVHYSDIICANKKILPISNRYRKSVHNAFLEQRDNVYE